MIKVLFLASNPEGTVHVNLDEEIRRITQKLRAAEFRDVKLESLWAVRPDELLQALLEHKPHIVHFSGHGNTSGEIILMDNNRQVKPVSAEALRKLFATLKDNIRVVVLNACYSQIQAAAIAEVIDCVIGMGQAISDEAAITFSATFYEAIGFGRSISEAVELGKTAIMLEGIPEADTPQLISRLDVDPTKIVLVGERPIISPPPNPKNGSNLDSQQWDHLADFLCRAENYRTLDTLVEKLMECRSLSDKNRRSIVVGRLPSKIKEEIIDNDVLKITIHSMVTTSCYYPNGFQAFIEIVQDIEQGSRQMQRVTEFLDHLMTQMSK